MSSVAPARKQKNSAQRGLPDRILAFISDTRFLSAVGQIIFLAVVIFLLSSVWQNMSSALQSRGLTPNFDFLQNRAGFEIGGAANYSPNDSYWQAYLVGLNNTLMVVVVGLISATVLGIIGGVLLLSSNWLVRNITRFIVEILRNSPLLVVIYIMFFVVVLALPPLRESITLPGAGLLPIPLRYAVYLLGAFIIWRSARTNRDPHFGSSAWSALLAFVIATELLFAIDNRRPLGEAVTYGAANFGDPQWLLYLLITGVLALIIALTPQSLAYVLTNIIPRPTLLWLLFGQLAAAAVFYFGIIPSGALITETQPAFYLNNRGVTFPEFLATGRFALWMAFVLLGAGFGAGAFIYLRRVTETTGKPNPRTGISLLILCGAAIIGWVIVSAQPAQVTVPVEQGGTVVNLPLDEAREQGLLTLEDELAYSRTPLELRLPERQGLRLRGGQTLSPEYVALTLALVIYTAAFIAEIVRAGILAVPRGQLEAARALGLGGGQVLRMVILPQALRVIIPPLTNQYLNLAKNSSLAIAISFADTYQVMNTVINQSGQAITGIIIVMVTYLVISLVTAAVMNVINGRFQLVTR